MIYVLNLKLILVAVMLWSSCPVLKFKCECRNIFWYGRYFAEGFVSKYLKIWNLFMKILFNKNILHRLFYFRRPASFLMTAYIHYS